MEVTASSALGHQHDTLSTTETSFKSWLSDSARTLRIRNGCKCTVRDVALGAAAEAQLSTGPRVAGYTALQMTLSEQMNSSLYGSIYVDQSTHVPGRKYQFDSSSPQGLRCVPASRNIRLNCKFGAGLGICWS